jgi:hypothetical protein
MANDQPADELYDVIDAALALSRDQRIALRYAVEASLLPDPDEAVVEDSRRMSEDMREGRIAPVPFEALLEEPDRMARS